MLIYLNLIETEEEKNKFEQIYHMYRNIMFYVAKNILKDDYLSEDAVHNAFINIAENMKNISDVHSKRTKSYVVIIVRNISLNMLKKQKLIVELDEFIEIEGDDHNLEDEVLAKLSFDFIVDEIMKMPLIYKDVLYLSYVEDLRTLEISKLINVSNETVKKRLQRGRRILLENIS